MYDTYDQEHGDQEEEGEGGEFAYPGIWSFYARSDLVDHDDHESTNEYQEGSREKVCDHFMRLQLVWILDTTIKIQDFLSLNKYLQRA